MYQLEANVLAVLKADTALTALVAASHITAAEVWSLPTDAPFPHVSCASGAPDSGVLNIPNSPGKSTFRIWVEAKDSRDTAVQAADRIHALLNRQHKALSGSGATVILFKAIGSPLAIRDPRTGAHTVAMEFDVIAA